MKGLIFTYVLAYGGAVAALFRPWYGLLIYVCFSIIKPESLWHWAFSGGGNFSRVIFFGLFFGWLINGCGNWNLGRSKATVLAFVGFWMWALASALLVASDQEVAFAFLENLAKILLPFLVGISLIRTEQDLKQLAWVILISQGYVAWEMNLSYLDGFNPLDSNIGTGKFGGMDNNCVAIAMVTGAGLAYFLGAHQTIWWRKWLCFFCAGLMAHTIMFAMSRGGMLALVILGVVSFLLIDKRPKDYAFYALAIFVALMLAGPSVRERFSTVFLDEEERDGSAQSRVDMWKICIRLMQDNPVFGIGPSHFRVHASTYGLTDGKLAHTLWLQIGAELGVIGLGFLLLFYLATVFKLWPMARRKAPLASEWDVAVARMIIASFAGFMISAQFVSLEGLELPYYITLIGAGTLKLASARKTADNQANLQWNAMPPPEQYQPELVAAPRR